MVTTTETSTRDAGAPDGEAATTKPRRSLAWLTARGFAWNLIGSGISHSLWLAATVVVARWLTPVDYAIGGLGIAAIGLFQILTTQGFASALVRLQDLSSRTCDTVFWPVVGTGAVLASFAVFAAPTAAAFYGRPEIVEVVPILAVGLFATTLGAVPHALLQRAMRFRAIGGARVVSTVLSAGLGIGLAIGGYGYFALVVPGAAASVLSCIIAFALTRYRPRPRFSKREFDRVRTFGLSLLGSSALQFTSDNADYLILGRFWAAARFGHYYFSFERARQPFNMIFSQLVDVLFPSLSRVQDQKEKLRWAYLQGTEKFCLLIFPLHVLLIGLADLVVPWIFGAQWGPAVPVFQIFALWAFVRGFGVVAPPTYLALDKAQYNLAFNAFRLAVILPVLLVLGFSGASTETTAITLLLVWTVQMPFYLVGLFRLIDLQLRDLLSSMRVVVFATLAMGAAIFVTRVFAKESAWPVAVEVSLASVSACLVYLVVARSRLRAAARELGGIFRNK